MGQRKRQKQKNEKKKRVRHASESDAAKLRAMLADFGLSVREVLGDGNCLFRAFALQHCGDDAKHDEYRSTCCDYLEAHAEEFRNFQVDAEERTFSDYVEEMREDAIWGSQLEISALCLAYGVSAVVFQADGVHLELGLAEPDQDTVLISFQDDEHFNAVSFGGDELQTLAEVRKIVEGSSDKRRKATKLPSQGLVQV
jgi:OTU domain-containing protein 3